MQRVAHGRLLSPGNTRAVLWERKGVKRRSSLKLQRQAVSAKAWFNRRPPAGTVRVIVATICADVPNSKRSTTGIQTMPALRHNSLLRDVHRTSSPRDLQKSVELYMSGAIKIATITHGKNGVTALMHYAHLGDAKLLNTWSRKIQVLILLLFQAPMTARIINKTF